MEPIVATSWLQTIASAPPLYVFFGCSLAALGFALAIMATTRWGRSRPLYRCALLSLLAHAILACVATTIQMMYGNPAPVGSLPIRVKVIGDLSLPPPVVAKQDTAEESPPKLQPPKLIEEPAKTDVVETKRADPSKPLVAPELMPAPPQPAPPRVDVAQSAPEPNKPAATTETTPSTQGELATSPLLPSPVAVPTPAASAEPPGPPQELWSPVVGEGLPGSQDEGPAQAPYINRVIPNRLRLVEEEGGSEETEDAVTAALIWLAEAQSVDGRWDAVRHGAGEERVVLGHNRGGAGLNADTGVTGLALLAFLGTGNTHKRGEYATNVRGGINYLIRIQGTDGNLAGSATLYARMYCHAMASFALAEAYAMSGDARLEPAVRRAVDYSLRAQHPATGGWRYRPGDTGDTSQLGWQLMALRSAERGGVAVPQACWTGIERFLRTVERGTYGGLASYRPDSGPSRTMTAEAMFCRQLLSEIQDSAMHERATSEATRYLTSELPRGQQLNLYYWYYATLALHRQKARTPEADEAWQAWNEALKDALLATQIERGPEAGSWDTSCIWGGYGGRVYTTAVAALCLEVYYRYAPSRDNGAWVAAEDDETRR